MKDSELPTGHAGSTPPGFLVVLGGRHAGARRDLGAPLTFLGRAPGCDVRLNDDAVEPLHCLIAAGPDGLILRDLNSQQGTLVNGRRVTAALLRDEDQIAVGPFKFRVQLAPPAAPERSALRIQAAAVAAQQAALDEEEARLTQRRAALQQQEEQLAAHLEEKRRQLVELAERVRADRADFERHVAAENERLARQAEQSSAEQQVRAELKRQQIRLAEEQVFVNTQRELDSRLLQEGWDCLEQDRQAWRERRAKERAALRLRRRELEQAERKLAEARRLLVREKEAWDAQRRGLEDELHGLNNRVAQQRQKLHDLRDERDRLEAPSVGGDVPAPATVAADLPAEEQTRLALLGQLAGDLADQRALLVEQWERLDRVRHQWQQQHDQAADELEALARRLDSQGQEFARREQSLAAEEVRLKQRRAELEARRQDLLLWRARLQAQEHAWEGERLHALKLVRQKEEQAERQLTSLAELRADWERQRRDEAEALRAEQAAARQVRADVDRLRLELTKQAAHLADEKRLLTEQALALAEYRQGVLAGADDPAAVQRLEQLRRRWLDGQESLLQTTRKERSALHQELSAVEAKRAELLQREARLTRARVELDERAAALDHREALLATRQARLEQDVRRAEGQRALAELRGRAAQDQVERLTQALLDDAEPPILPAERAA